MAFTKMNAPIFVSNEILTNISRDLNAPRVILYLSTGAEAGGPLFAIAMSRVRVGLHIPERFRNGLVIITALGMMWHRAILSDP